MVPLRRYFGDWKGPLSSQLSRSRRVLRTAAVGHEERFPPTRLNVGCGFRKETIAGTDRNGRDAPIADRPALAPERFDPKRSLVPLNRSSADAP